MNYEKYTFSRINNLALAPARFVADCTENYRNQVRKAAERIYADSGKKIIMLAGPSSSGKTTTAQFLSREMQSLGAKAYTVSLDDFYFSQAAGRYPTDENGKPDYESVYALDLELLHSRLGALAEESRAFVPKFDFMSGERDDNAREIILKENDVIIIEGIHALNPIISETLREENIFRLYVSVSSRVYENDGSVLLSKRDLRFVRRIIRDNRFRATGPEKTFEIWQSVLRGEDRYLFPFEQLADMRINSFHPCEPCVFADEALALLSGVGGEYGEKAALLSNKLSLFKKTDYSILPQDSLLREFTG